MDEKAIGNDDCAQEDKQIISLPPSKAESNTEQEVATEMEAARTKIYDRNQWRSYRGPRRRMQKEVDAQIPSLETGHTSSEQLHEIEGSVVKGWP